MRWLEVMLREMPKHKASEKLQSELKQKISRTKKELESERKTVKKTLRSRREHSATRGRHRDHSRRTERRQKPTAGRADQRQAGNRPYPFTTRTPLPGMMAWEDVTVQLIDTPPVTADFMETYLQGLIRGADVVVLLVDLDSDDGIEQLQDLLARLNATKTRLGKETYLDEEDLGLSFTQTILVPNKIDLEDASLRSRCCTKFCPLDFHRTDRSPPRAATTCRNSATPFTARWMSFASTPRRRPPSRPWIGPTRFAAAARWSMLPR